MRKLDKKMKRKRTTKGGEVQARSCGVDLSDSPSAKTNSSHANGRQLGYCNDSKQTHGHHPPPFFQRNDFDDNCTTHHETLFFLNHLLLRSLLSAIRLFFFFFYSTPNVILKANNLKSLRNSLYTRALVAVLFDLPFHTSTFDAQSQERKQTNKPEKKNSFKKRKEKILLAFCSIAVFF
ncbi:hypothetical protein TRIATDRAFT_230117 [Trichoderma atroviride IMI 206040]|uniref:Uncharacterized protein n=1 Tax=Hypocrea atroviridis (strain ATCC 20476 / IMI 206040) TaxID=452589 RepID=G9PAC4_HYPAI|nr:uncharacterized protein TRIATDRAFT_230117 [Trichoderma atroviride IMI 206040]EHK39960.1 hypothetical protein TRIATDRAFT_230117 [Trichoderma atroviride IMI 206040]